MPAVVGTFETVVAAVVEASAVAAASVAGVSAVDAAAAVVGTEGAVDRLAVEGDLHMEVGQPVPLVEVAAEQVGWTCWLAG